MKPKLIALNPVCAAGRLPRSLVVCFPVFGKRNFPFIPINCAAIPENLIESELFGHEKGAFTGAHTAKQGKFEQAKGGVIFLDEIGELPLQLQVRLLRVLEERNFYRVGGNRSINVDVMIIAATNKDLLTRVKEGKFREDLYFRLNVINIWVPMFFVFITALGVGGLYFTSKN